VVDETNLCCGNATADEPCSSCLGLGEGFETMFCGTTEPVSSEEITMLRLMREECGNNITYVFLFLCPLWSRVLIGAFAVRCLEEQNGGFYFLPGEPEGSRFGLDMLKNGLRDIYEETASNTWVELDTISINDFQIKRGSFRIMSPPTPTPGIPIAIANETVLTLTFSDDFSATTTDTFGDSRSLSISRFEQVQALGDTLITTR